MIMSKHRGSQNPIGTLKRIFGFMFQTYGWRLIGVLSLIFVSTFANIRGSLFLQVVVDDYVTPLLGTANPNFSGLLKAVLTMALIYGIGILANLLYNMMMVTISEGTQKQIRNQLFTHMESLPIRYFDQHSFGSIMSHYTNDIDTLRQMMSQSLPNLIAALVSFVSTFIAMFTISIPLTLFVMISVTLMMLTIRFIAGRSGKFFGQQQRDIARVNGYIEEMIHGQKVVKIFNHEQKVVTDFENITEDLRESATQANIYANSLMPIMMNLLNIQYVLVAVVGGLFSIYGISGLTIGMIASFLQLSRSLNMPISQISQQINFVIMALAGAERIFSLMDEPAETDSGTTTLVHATYDENGHLSESSTRTGMWAWKVRQVDGMYHYTRVTGDVTFEHVDFSYDEDKQILHDINLFAKPGQKIAFVGATGAGKTTITNLINRFYDIQKGQIFYDGIDIKQITKESLRQSLGVVLQDTHLFTGTIKENIRYGKLDATDAEVYAAAKLANADYFIEKLADGYDTVISGSGDSLSQGQRQLLAIARAAIANPPVMILDEATSSIDTRTELIVQEGMDRLMEGRTVFVIAHRLSTIQNADVIMVMDHGRIIERGTHHSLLGELGLYHQLATGVIEMD
ncbi:ABC transporter [Vagococcus penaei]|uniref:ABC transporter n=2 Tax=Vagococcus penaei TaxID=633807 RepID=A0A1Q2D520_9ENTE|nr:ABC transporter [Vagococcus penaei]RSU00872.1 ABC transporter [Vagococcus penaei]